MNEDDFLDLILNILKVIFAVLVVFIIFNFVKTAVDSPEFKDKQNVIYSEQVIESDIFEIVEDDINNNCKLIRFKFNDTLFMYCKSGYGVGLTQMYDVDGMPLTYEKYLQN